MVGLYYSGEYGACTQGADAHHIQHKGAGGGDTKENLITLCRVHHNKVHNGNISREKLRMILKHWYSYEYN